MGPRLSSYSATVHGWPSPTQSRLCFRDVQEFIAGIDTQFCLLARLEWVDRTLTLTTFLDAIATSHPYKAGGLDGLTVDVLKCLTADNAAPLLAQLRSYALKEASQRILERPEAWGCSGAHLAPGIPTLGDF